MEIKIIKFWEDPITHSIMMAYEIDIAPGSEDRIRQVHGFESWDGIRAWLAMVGESDELGHAQGLTVMNVQDNYIPDDLQQYVGQDTDCQHFCTCYREKLEEFRAFAEEERKRQIEEYQVIEEERARQDREIQERDQLMRELEEDLRQANGQQERLKHPENLKQIRKMRNQSRDVEREQRAKGLISEPGTFKDTSQ